MFKGKRKTLLGERRRRRRNVIASIFCIGVIVLCTVLFFILRKGEWQISEVYVYGGESISQDQVEDAIWDELSGKYIYVFPRTSLFIYPSGAITDGVMGNFSRIKDVELDLELPRTLHVTLEEYKPYALWCERKEKGIYDPVAISTDTDIRKGDCYYIDNQGYIFDEAPSFREGIYFMYIGGVSNPLRSYIFVDDYFIKFEAFRKQVQDIGLSSQALIINEDETFVMELTEGGVILLDKDIPLGVAYDNLASVLKDPDAGFVSRDKIEYIDLRYLRKVYYKINE